MADLINRQSTCDDVKTKVNKLINELVKILPIWDTMSDKKKKQFLKDNKDPLLSDAFKLFKKLRPIFEFMDKD
jgi:hypothetical protein